MIKHFLKNILKLLRIDINKITERFAKWSIRFALFESEFNYLVERLRKIVPDISHQYSDNPKNFNDYWELKIRGMHVFQCFLMLKALDNLALKDRLVVVDIGDSAGTHMLYLKELTRGKFDIDTLSVNLDPRAIDKIKARGLNALLCHAEELDLRERKVNLFVSFEMLEHLHNPANFLRRLAKKSQGNRIVISVPYVRNSRVALYHIRNKLFKSVFSEEEHIFEFSPDDWSLLMAHSGWKVIYSKIYYQYPRRIPIFSNGLASYWRRADFEGFWGAILERDTSISDLYLDWEDEIDAQQKCHI